MLNWSMIDLAQAANVSVSTVKRLEADENFPVSNNIRLLVRDAFQAAGITFIEDDGAGIGLRLKTRDGQAVTGA